MPKRGSNDHTYPQGYTNVHIQHVSLQSTHTHTHLNRFTVKIMNWTWHLPVTTFDLVILSPLATRYVLRDTYEGNLLQGPRQSPPTAQRDNSLFSLLILLLVSCPMLSCLVVTGSPVNRVSSSFNPALFCRICSPFPLTLPSFPFSASPLILPLGRVKTKEEREKGQICN